MHWHRHLGGARITTGSIARNAVSLIVDVVCRGSVSSKAITGITKQATSSRGPEEEELNIRTVHNNKLCLGTLQIT